MQCVRRRRPPGGASAHRCDGGSVLYYLPVSSPGCVRCVCEHALEVSGPLVGVLFLILSDSSQERHEKTPPVRGHSPRLSAAFLACPGLSRLSESVRRDLQASSTTRPAVAGWVQRAPRMLRRQRHVPDGRSGPRRPPSSEARSVGPVGLARSFARPLGPRFFTPDNLFTTSPSLCSHRTHYATQRLSLPPGASSPCLSHLARRGTSWHALHTSRGVARARLQRRHRRVWKVGQSCVEE